MKLCYCGQPVFGKGFCKSHQFMREDYDSRSIAQKSMDKARIQTKVRGLATNTNNEETESLNNLISDLDYLVSRYVRLVASNEKGIAQCYTCTKQQHWTLMDAAHFIKRSNLQFRFDVKWNLRCSCKNCNEFEEKKHLKVFSEKLEEEQKGITEWLIEESRKVYKHSQDELKEMIIDFRKKVKILEGKIKK
jgi:hypothetical protein